MVKDWTPGTFPLSERVPRTSPQQTSNMTNLLRASDTRSSATKG